MACASLLLVSCSGKEETATKQVDEKPLVKIQKVYEQEVPQMAEYTATVEGFKTNNISTSTPNRIKRILVDVGSPVRAGQALVILDDVNIEQQKIRLANQKVNLDRAKELLAIGGGTQQTVDQLQAEYDAAMRAYNNVSKTYDSSFASAGYNHNILMSSAQLNWATYDNVVSDYFVQNGSFVKLDNITLGYSFENFLASGKYKGMSGRIYAAATNVATFTKYKGLDPEVSGGIDNNLYPRPFTVQLGLNVNF